MDLIKVAEQSSKKQITKWVNDPLSSPVIFNLSGEKLIVLSVMLEYQLVEVQDWYGVKFTDSQNELIISSILEKCTYDHAGVCFRFFKAMMDGTLSSHKNLSPSVFMTLFTQFYNDEVDVIAEQRENRHTAIKNEASDIVDISSKVLREIIDNLKNQMTLTQEKTHQEIKQRSESRHKEYLINNLVIKQINEIGEIDFNSLYTTESIKHIQDYRAHLDTLQLEQLQSMHDNPE